MSNQMRDKDVEFRRNEIIKIYPSSPADVESEAESDSICNDPLFNGLDLAPDVDPQPGGELQRGERNKERKGEDRKKTLETRNQANAMKDQIEKSVETEHKEENFIQTDARPTRRSKLRAKEAWSTLINFVLRAKKKEFLRPRGNLVYPVVWDENSDSDWPGQFCPSAGLQEADQDPDTSRESESDRETDDEEDSDDGREEILMNLRLIDEQSEAEEYESSEDGRESSEEGRERILAGLRMIDQEVDDGGISSNEGNFETPPQCSEHSSPAGSTGRASTTPA